jgi:hypothetical protein
MQIMPAGFRIYRSNCGALGGAPECVNLFALSNIRRSSLLAETPAATLDAN